MSDCVGSYENRQMAEAILEAHRIPFQRVVPVSRAFRNIVFRVDRNYVLRFNTLPSSGSRMGREVELTSSLAGVAPIPRLVQSGSWRAAWFQLWEYVEGEQLADAWPKLEPAGQVQIIDELCTILERIHAIQFDDFGSLCGRHTAYASWPDYLRAELADGPPTFGLSPRWTNRFEDIRSRIEDYAGCCEWHEAPCLVHNDLLMTNVIVHQGRIVALIDWELALKGPVDMEVYKLESFCRSPEIVGVTGEFGRLWELMVRRYPRIFLHSGLTERLNTYDLLAAWRMFRFEVRRGAALDTLFPRLLAHARQIIEGNVERLAATI